ncbi:MAG TPA: phosphoribosylanthranilate isomerase [Methanocella sp.]|nr:phosphoribosylanthranilate isomerase [Methanocella sp.]
MTRVKICGITSPEDAVECASSGADAIGMLVDVEISPRRITVEEARQIVSALPPFVASVIVMTPSTPDNVIEAVKKVQPAAVQLHGDEPADMLWQIRRQLPGVKLIKTIHVGEGDEIEKARRYESAADAILLDTSSPLGGGAGIVHDWTISRKIIDTVRLPVILAGGLSPKNVRDAVKATHPYAVDACSGVEAKKREKDLRLVQEFIRQAKVIT